MKIKKSVFALAMCCAMGVGFAAPSFLADISATNDFGDYKKIESVKSWQPFFMNKKATKVKNIDKRENLKAAAAEKREQIKNNRQLRREKMEQMKLNKGEREEIRAEIKAKREEIKTLHLEIRELLKKLGSVNNVIDENGEINIDVNQMIEDAMEGALEDVDIEMESEDWDDEDEWED